MTERVRLQGCTPTPLANYLKALAVLRLVAEQKDSNATGWWEQESFKLGGRLGKEALKRFFLEEYAPTPVIAPWNGGSGFYPNDNQQAITAIRSSTTERLSEYRVAIDAGRNALTGLQIEESPKDKGLKTQLLTLLRSVLSEQALAWVDAAVMLTGEEPKYPPLLGTGGNDGRLDFTNNFMQRLGDVLDSKSGKATSSSRVLLDQALFGDSCPDLSGKAIGQFAPGQAGGPNAGTGFEAGAIMNPWDFVLMIEGALLFAAATTRRFSGDSGGLSFPFTVRPSGVGSGAASINDEAPARAEIWLPLWSRRASIGELKGLLSEGRSTVGKRPAKDGLDFARAVSQLAVNRGIDSFERYAFLMRSGKAYLATPLGRFNVPSKPSADLVVDLENGYWLSRFQSHARRTEAPARLRTLARRLDDALFDLTQRGKDAAPKVQKALIVLGEIQRYASTSPAWREKAPPIPKLRDRWVNESNDSTPEFQIACALAGLYVLDTKYPMPMRAHFAPETGDSRAWLNEGGSHVQCVWSHASLERNLSSVLQTRLLRAGQQGIADKPLSSSFGCDIGAISAFLASETDNKKIGDLLAGLSLCHIPSLSQKQLDEGATLSVAFGLLKLLFSSDVQLRNIGLIGEKDRLPVPLKLIRLLLAGRGEQALREGWRRLRIAGFGQVPLPRISGIDNTRLAAALLIPVNDSALWQIARSLLIEQAAEHKTS